MHKVESCQESVPSYYSQASNTTNKSSYVCNPKKCLKDYERVQCIIRLKILLAVITMVGGAILALCINFWTFKQTNPKSKSRSLKDSQMIFPSEYFETESTANNEVFDYCQLEAFRPNKYDKTMCLDDMQTKEPLIEKIRLYLTTCERSFKTSQFFHYNRTDGTLSKPKQALVKDDRMCIDVEHFTVLLNKCKPNKPEQYWQYHLIGTGPAVIYHNFTGHCLAANVVNRPATLKICSQEMKEPPELWKCLPVEKDFKRIFFDDKDNDSPLTIL